MALPTVYGVLKVPEHSFLKYIIHKVVAFSAMSGVPKAGVSQEKGRGEEEK